jgi:hypothetical protein
MKPSIIERHDCKQIYNRFLSALMKVQGMLLLKKPIIWLTTNLYNGKEKVNV